MVSCVFSKMEWIGMGFFGEIDEQAVQFHLYVSFELCF